MPALAAKRRTSQTNSADYSFHIRPRARSFGINPAGIRIIGIYASKRLFGSYSYSGLHMDFHSGYSAPGSRIAGIYFGIYSYSGMSQTNAPQWFD